MKHLIVIAAVMSLVISCDEQSHDETPPPIAHGKCLVDRYVGTTAMDQNCVHGGYVWSCKWSVGVLSCDRGPEASGERSPTEVPTAPVDAK